MTCRHFRNRIPREEADELRDADLELCPVCDRLPHRRGRVLSNHLERELLAVGLEDDQPSWQD